MAKKEKFWTNPPEINSSPKKLVLCWPWLSRPIVLKPKLYWKITSNEISKDDKAAERKKYLKFIILSSLNRYIVSKNIKNLKNNTDFINLNKLSYSYPSKYKDFIKLRNVEKKTTINNKKIIFKVKSSLIVKIFDLNWKIPKIQKNTRFKFIIKFPTIKLIGKKAKIRFINETDFISKILLSKTMIILLKP